MKLKIKSLLAATLILSGCTTMTENLGNSSVMVVNQDQNSGGSGTIVSSSEILTNKHVCRLIENGGYVVKNGEAYQIEAYKKYPKHDLCLVRITDHLSGAVSLASSGPRMFSKSVSVGHPLLLPTIISEGYFSANEYIQLVVGFRQCSPESDEYCSQFGGMPIVQTFLSTVSSVHSQPGSSGSGVFNAKGQLTAVVFAGSGEFSYALLVPYSYVANFLENADDYDYIAVGTRVKSDVMERIFAVEKECRDPKTKFHKLCKMIKRSMVWVEK